MTGLLQDIRQTVRGLRASPGFALAALCTLALGIGANTAIFSVVNGVLLQPLGYSDPAGLVVVLHEGSYPVSPADFLDWRKQARSFVQLAAAQAWGATLTGEGRAESLRGIQLSENMFTLLGVRPLLGRGFEPGDAQVAVLSHALWQRRFGADSSIVGRPMVLNGESFVVAGVMPESFHFAPFWATDAEVWTPLPLEKRLNDRGGRSLRVFGRLAPGVSVKQAQSEVDLICRRLAAVYPATNTGMTARVVPLREKVVANVRPTLLVLLGTVGFVLLIACSNVANLMLVRASVRQREIAVRLALGSSRARLIGQFVLESLLLSGIGAAAAVAIARWGITAIIAALPAGSLPRLHEISLDRTVLLFTALLTVATGVLCGVFPALRAFRTDVQQALKGGLRGSTQGPGERRTGALLVIVELALAMVLLAGAGLMLRTFERLQAVDAGFDPRNLLTMEVAAKRPQFFAELRPRLEALPGVESVGLINHLPIGGDLWTLGVKIAGRPEPPPGQGPSAAYRVVQPGYFRAMRIALLRGRDFTAIEPAPVAIVNEAMARKYWGAADPLGARVSLDDGATWMRIAGVIRDVKQSDWIARPDAEIYVPYSQVVPPRYLTVVMRVSGNPSALARAAEDAVRGIDNDVPVARVRTMEQAIAGQLWRTRLAGLLIGIFAGVAVVLALVGIYGVISSTVVQRSAEIGVRVALGATPGDIVAMVLKQGLGVAGVGIGVGLMFAMFLTRALGGLLYGVTARDPLSFMLAAVVLLAISAAASLIPARRAKNVVAGYPFPGFSR